MTSQLMHIWAALNGTLKEDRKLGGGTCRREIQGDLGEESGGIVNIYENFRSKEML